VPKIPYLSENNDRFLYLTKEQAATLIADLPSHLSAMTRFALATGLRRANITGLEWQNINIDRKIAWVWADDAKGKRHIPVPLNKDALEVLNEQRGTSKGTHVFTYKDTPVAKTTAAWQKAIARAGIDPDFTFHCLRHTWASWHVMAGTPLSVLQRLGGGGH
jgi:integrase